ncbi:MAG: VCBS repeat-containing protein, partial [Chloroflexota bacterium]
MKRVIWVMAALVICAMFVSITGYQAEEVEAQGPVTDGARLLQMPEFLQNRPSGATNQSVIDRAPASPADSKTAPVDGLTGWLQDQPWTAAADCGVPESGPFGRDVEILLNDRHFEAVADWHNQTRLPCADNASGFSRPASDIAAAALNTSKIAAVWRKNGGSSLYYSIWNDGDVRSTWDEVARNGPFDNGYEVTPPYVFTDDNYQSVQSADVNGDGIDELLARSDEFGIQVYSFDVDAGNWILLSGSGPFTPPWPAGFNDADNYTTFHAGDIDGDGREELLVRLDSGMEIWKFDGTGWSKISSNGPFANGYPQGCGGCVFDEDNWATIHLADVDDDGVDELLGRMDLGMEIWEFDSGVWSKIPGHGPFYNGLDQGCSPCGFDRDNWATIHSADIDGDGQDELLARLDTGMQAWKFISPTWQLVASDSLFSNWWEPGSYKFYDDNYPSVHSGDVDGDGVDEVVARSDQYGLVAYRYDATIQGWVMVAQYGPYGIPMPYNFDGDNWGTFHSGDLDGDQKDEILVREDQGMVAWRVSLAPGAWGADQGSPGGLTAEGTPAVLAIGGDRWEVYARNGGGIQVSAWDGPGQFSAPEDVPG